MGRISPPFLLAHSAVRFCRMQTSRPVAHRMLCLHTSVITLAKHVVWMEDAACLGYQLPVYHLGGKLGSRSVRAQAEILPREHREEGGSQRRERGIWKRGVVAFEFGWWRAQMKIEALSHLGPLALGQSDEVNRSLSMGTVVSVHLFLAHPLGSLRGSVW